MWIIMWIQVFGKFIVIHSPEFWACGRINLLKSIMMISELKHHSNLPRSTENPAGHNPDYHVQGGHPDDL